VLSIYNLCDLTITCLTQEWNSTAPDIIAGNSEGGSVS
jgi:hypothetical protein